MSDKRDIDDFADVASDKRVIEASARFSRAEERKKMFDKLSIDMETKLKQERIGPRPVLSKVEREIRQAEQDCSTSQRKLDDLKLQSNIRKAAITRAQEEFRFLIHRGVDLEHPVELDSVRIEAAKKKLEAKVKRITKEIGNIEKKIPKLMQEDLTYRGRFEQLMIQSESIRSGFRDLPIEKDPRMTSFHRERNNIEIEYDNAKKDRDDTIHQVRREKKRKQERLADKPPRRKGSK